MRVGCKFDRSGFLNIWGGRVKCRNPPSLKIQPPPSDSDFGCPAEIAESRLS